MENDLTGIEGRMLALKVIIAHLVAASRLDISALHEELTTELSALIETGDTPATDVANVMFSAACHEIDSLLLYARTRRPVK